VLKPKQVILAAEQYGIKVVMKILILIALTFLAATASAENIGWRDQNGDPIPNTDFMKTINGFGGWLVVTPDQDWDKKWNTPAENIPHFKEAKEVHYGQELTILIFFTNPKLDEKNKINIVCDIKVVRPDETFSANTKDVSCANWEAQPGQYKYSIQLAQTVIRYVGEKKDPPGIWRVIINLKDINSGIEVPLQTEFHLVKSPHKSKPSGSKNATLGVKSN